MSLLSKLKLALTPKLYGYKPANLSPQAPVFIELVASLKYAEAEALFYAEPLTSRSFLIEAACDLIDDDGFFDDWFDKSNGPLLSFLFRGALLTQRAWHYRGWGRGADVNDTQADMMITTLQKAYNSLIPTINDEELGQEAAAKLIRVLMGLNAEWDDIDEALLRLRSHSQPHIFGEINYLVASCEKWLGSHDKMFDFARNALERFPGNPEIGALTAIAHWERQLYFDVFDEDEPGGNAYRENPTVLEEVTLQSRRLLNEKGNDLKDIIAHNAFAAFFCDRDEWEMAKPHFQKMKLMVCRYPWNFYDGKYLNRVYNIALL